LFKATAYIVGPVDGPGAALSDMAKRLGFEAVLPFAGTATAEQQTARTPLLFFLFAAVNDVSTHKDTADAIRFSSSRRVRLSPLIYFSESPSLDGIRACADMGFDDVVTLPFSRERVIERLGRQVNRTVVYYETPTYFGPDRRTQADAAAGERRGMAGRIRRLEIIRSIGDGPSVIRDDARAA
jgi:DNA-binding response OmpR family regulator